MDTVKTIMIGDYTYKPCKKCGNEIPNRIRYGHFGGGPDTFRCTCSDCGYQTKEKPTLQEAVDAWNSVCKPYPKKAEQQI